MRFYCFFIVIPLLQWIYCVCVHTYIYIYTRGAYDKFPVFFRIGIWNCHRFLKIQYVIAIHLMRGLTNFYDFRFKWTAIAGIRIHPTQVWLSQLVNFKNAIWHFRRMICNKIVLNLKKCHRNVWNASDWFWTILHELSISFWEA